MEFVIGNTMVQIDLWLVILALIIIIALAVFIINRAIIAHRFKISAGKEDFIGRKAEVKIALAPRGVVFLDGERWTAIAEEGQAEVGEEVVISRVQGLVLYVAANKEGENK